MESHKYTKEIIERYVKNSFSYSELLRNINAKKVKGGGSSSYIKKLLFIYDIDTTHFKGRGWSKGLTKENSSSIRSNSEKIAEYYKNNIHNQTGNPIAPEIKKKISESMKLAHSEGRAHNIGMSRWNNTPSYPESFFMKVIENEFSDKNYHFEYPQGIYSIDFAWVHKKKYIEIDGEQHERFPEYAARDNRKDLFLLENGWMVLRIKWKDMHNNTKFWISKAKEFIDGLDKVL